MIIMNMIMMMITIRGGCVRDTAGAEDGSPTRLPCFNHAARETSGFVRFSPSRYRRPPSVVIHEAQVLLQPQATAASGMCGHMWL